MRVFGLSIRSCSPKALRGQLGAARPPAGHSHNICTGNINSCRVTQPGKVFLNPAGRAELPCLLGARSLCSLGAGRICSLFFEAARCTLALFWQVAAVGIVPGPGGTGAGRGGLAGSVASER